MAQDLKALLLAEQPTGEFEPYCHFSEAADSLTVYFRRDADFSRLLNDHVTLFLSLEKQELVGCRIKGISDIIADLPNYVDVKHEGIHLSLVFLSLRGSDPTDEARETFNRLAQAAGKLKLPDEATAV